MMVRDKCENEGENVKKKWGGREWEEGERKMEWRKGEEGVEGSGKKVKKGWNEDRVEEGKNE